VITVNVHSNGQVLENDLPLTSISDILEKPDQLIWLDVADPTADDLSLLASELHIHPLAAEDIQRQHQRPKVDFYDSAILIVFYSLQTTAQEPVVLVEIELLVGKNFVVSFHEGTILLLGDIRDRWCRNLEEIGDRTTGLLVYSILDAIVDDYFPYIDQLSERVEALEEEIFQGFRTETQKEIFRLKKELLSVRRILAPQRDVVNVLLRRDDPIFDQSTQVYFQDLYDHVIRVTDAVDTYRDLMSSALDSYLTVTSNRLNQVMKTLTASSIILMSMTLVASVYGMNFDHIPELHWNLGYAWALGLMAVIGFSLYSVFRRIDWL
jgi:magnesium transporter